MESNINTDTRKILKSQYYLPKAVDTQNKMWYNNRNGKIPNL